VVEQQLLIVTSELYY